MGIKKTSKSFVKFINRIICQLKTNGQHRTMLHYIAARNSFMRFREQQDISLGEMDADMMKAYQEYLMNVAGVCRNTSSFYMRILRAVYNKAVENGYITQQHPFAQVYTGIAKTKKRAIPTESVRQIKEMPQSALSEQQELARDTFLMCFYLRGISFIDLAHLRKTDIKNGILHYTRSKTKQRLSLRWTAEMQAIVDKYQSRTALSSYLFPFLVTDNSSRQQDERRLYHNAEGRIAYHLKKLGIQLGLEGKLTLYVARHSWATAARDHSMPLSFISEALGHTSTTTTEIYLSTIRSSDLGDACDKLLAEI